MKFDVAVIGAGAVGCAIAGKLAEYALDIAVVEKEIDVAFGNSGRNSGVIHAGFNNKPGSLMAALCVEGCEGFERVAQRLGIEFRRTGKLVTALHEEDLPTLEKLYDQGLANAVRGLRLIDAAEIKKINGNFNGVRGLWSEMTGVFDPFAYTAALAEHAVQNGVRFFFDFEAGAIAAGKDGFTLTAAGSGRCVEARWVINSAGLHADAVCRMVGIDDYVIHPCRGEYHILDPKAGKYVNVPVYPVPGERSGGLGVHLTPSLSGNVMIGPSAEYIDEKEDFSDAGAVMEQLFREGKALLPVLERHHVIKSFAGVRPKLTAADQGGYADFVIEESQKVPQFIILAGIESPGLTSSMPIAEKVAAIILERDNPMENKAYESERKAGPAEGRGSGTGGGGSIVCRCEQITEAAILYAYDSICRIGAIPSMKGIRNRTRAGMGRCQGGFCAGRIVELLERKRGVDPLGFCWNSPKSKMFSGRTRP